MRSWPFQKGTRLASQYRYIVGFCASSSSTTNKINHEAINVHRFLHQPGTGKVAVGDNYPTSSTSSTFSSGKDVSKREKKRTAEYFLCLTFCFMRFLQQIVTLPTPSSTPVIRTETILIVLAVVHLNPSKCVSKRHIQRNLKVHEKVLTPSTTI